MSAPSAAASSALCSRCMIVSGPPRCEIVVSIRMMTPRSPISASAWRRAPAVSSTAVAPWSRARATSLAGSSVPACGPK